MISHINKPIKMTGQVNEDIKLNEDIDFGSCGYIEDNVWRNPHRIGRIKMVSDLEGGFKVFQTLDNYFVSKEGLPSVENQKEIGNKKFVLVCFLWNNYRFNQSFAKIEFNLIMNFIGCNMEKALYDAITCIEVKRDKRYVRIWLKDQTKDDKLISHIKNHLKSNTCGALYVRHADEMDIQRRCWDSDDN